jgi:hypothetical protein
MGVICFLVRFFVVAFLPLCAAAQAQSAPSREPPELRLK